jgi:hypothetical protein
MCGDDRGASALTQNGCGAPFAGGSDISQSITLSAAAKNGGPAYRRRLEPARKGTIRNRFFADR